MSINEFLENVSLFVADVATGGANRDWADVKRTAVKLISDSTEFLSLPDYLYAEYILPPSIALTDTLDWIGKKGNYSDFKLKMLKHFAVIENIINE